MGEAAGRRLAAHGVAEGAIVLLVLLWWLTARDLPDFVLPGPGQVAAATLGFVTDADLAAHALTSFLRVAAAVAVAMAIAVVLAQAVRASPVAAVVVERNLLVVLNSFPSVGWAILAVLWFNVSNATVIFIEVMIVLPFCLINALEGYRQIDPEIDELGRSLTRSRWRRFRLVTLPLVMPFLVAGLRIAYGIAWKIALVAELFGATSGLGYLLAQAQTTADAAMVFAVCIVIVFIFGAVDLLVLRPLARAYARNAAKGI